VTPGPAAGRRKRAIALRAALACPVLIVFAAAETSAQTLTSDMFRPVRDGFVTSQDLPFRKASENASDGGGQADGGELRGDKGRRAPSRIGAVPLSGAAAAASGAGEKIAYIEGHARFVGKREIEIAGSRHGAEVVVINVGARRTGPDLRSSCRQRRRDIRL